MSIEVHNQTNANLYEIMYIINYQKIFLKKKNLQSSHVTQYLILILRLLILSQVEAKREKN